MIALTSTLAILGFVASHQSLSDQLREAVGRSGFSRYEICKSTGIDPGAMSRFMSAQMGLRLDAIDRLAEFLDIRLSARRKAGRGKR